MVNLSIFEPGHYFAEGSYGFSETALRLPIESNFSVEVYPAYLLIEGKGQQHSGRPVYPFRVLLSRDMNSQSQAEISITITGVPELTGRASLVGPTSELMTNDTDHQNLLSARVVPLAKPRTYEISGLLVLGGKSWLPFHFRVVPTEAEVALENIVTLQKRA